MKIEPTQCFLQRWLLPACLAATALTACVSRSAVATTAAFDGDWSVRWCEQNRPDDQCGGFWLTLVQRGDQLCGAFDGARIGFAQVDEGLGTPVRGTVKGNEADLTIRSGRTLAVYRAHAEISGNRMRWTLGEQIVAPEFNDIIIIANDHVLARDTGPESERYKEMEAACSVN